MASIYLIYITKQTKSTYIDEYIAKIVYFQGHLDTDFGDYLNFPVFVDAGNEADTKEIARTAS